MDDDPIYGRKPRSVLDGYAPIPYGRYVRDYVRTWNGRQLFYDEVLVEENDDGTVTVLPSDAMPYPGRQIWRRVPDRTPLAAREQQT